MNNLISLESINRTAFGINVTQKSLKIIYLEKQNNKYIEFAKPTHVVLANLSCSITDCVIVCVYQT